MGFFIVSENVAVHSGGYAFTARNPHFFWSGRGASAQRGGHAEAGPGDQVASRQSSPVVE